MYVCVCVCVCICECVCVCVCERERVKAARTIANCLYLARTWNDSKLFFFFFFAKLANNYNAVHSHKILQIINHILNC